MSRFERFGARLGVLFCLGGFVLIFLGWNGAASSDRLPSQFPYLISGGIAGLGLIVLGAALIVVESRREDQHRLEQAISTLRETMERIAPEPEEEVVDTGTGPRVVVGHTSYHRPGCRLLEARGELPELSWEAASARGLIACRVCEPGAGAERPPGPRPRRPRSGRAKARRG